MNRNLRRAAGAAIVSVFSIYPVATYPQDVPAVLRDWGLLGAWSVDCARAPSRENPYLNYVVKSGEALEELDFGDGRDVATIAEARVEADGAITLHLHPKAESYKQFKQKITLVKGEGGRIRALRAGDMDGNDSVRDGIVLVTNSPTPWAARCR